MLRFIPVLCLVRTVITQLAGTMKSEMPPSFPVAKCTKAGGCILEQVNATLDANFRWKHSVKCYPGNPNCWSGGNCFDAGGWNRTICTDPEECAAKCALEGLETRDYKGSYGVTHISGGLHLNYVQYGASGMSIGSRLYMMESDVEEYKMFKLKNREISFDVDVHGLICGINGAVYFVEMKPDGGRSAGNKAGAKFGTGYCDAQCPHDIHFLHGEANLLDWDSDKGTGRYGHCCTEMDLWEANKEAAAYTPHPCEHVGPEVCDGTECGDGDERYDGICDKDGCDFNSYRLGAKNFFGDGANFDVDTSKLITVVTQFITEDGTDDGDLTEIRRLYVQDGKVIKNSHAMILGEDAKEMNSITDEFCKVQKNAFGETNDYAKKGGLKQIGESLDRGMVLVLSLWDDPLSEMNWLDAVSGKDEEMTALGDLRGPCQLGSGKTKKLREQHSYAAVDYKNFMYGELDSTYTAPYEQKPEVKDPVEEEGPAQPGPPPSSGPCGPFGLWIGLGALGALLAGAGGFYMYHKRRQYEGREPLTAAPSSSVA